MSTTRLIAFAPATTINANDVIYIAQDNAEKKLTFSAMAAAVAAAFPPGQGAYTTTTADFVQPIALANVNVQVVTTAWMAATEPVLIPGGGYYRVVSISDPTHAVLQNLGYTGNAAPTSTVSAGAKVAAAGERGQAGATGATGATGPEGPAGPMGATGPAGGVSGGTLTGALNAAAPVTIASSSTVAIGAAESNIVNISGTTTITAFDTIAAGAERELTFAGSLVLTHNATSLVLPGAANITTAAGDVAVFRSLGSGNWACVSYQRANGGVVATSAGIQKANAAGQLSAATAGTDFFSPAINGAPPVTLASASTVAIGAAASDNVTITGTTAITAFDTVAAGIRRFVTFSGILTLTHNATSLILPGAANITTAANDTAVMLSLGSGNWQCIAYQKAAGAGSGGGAWTNLGARVASNSATLDWTGLSGYSRYAVKLENVVPATTGYPLAVRLGFGATPTWLTSGYFQQYLAAYGSSIVAGQNTLASYWMAAVIASAFAPTGISGWIWLDAMQSSAPMLTADTTITGSSTIERDDAGGGLAAGAVPTAIRLLIPTGNISSGTATLYGIN